MVIIFERLHIKDCFSCIFLGKGIISLPMGHIINVFIIITSSDSKSTCIQKQILLLNAAFFCKHGGSSKF